MDDQLQTVDHLRRVALDLAIEFGPRLVVAIIIMTAGMYVAGWVGRLFQRAVHRYHLDPPVRHLLEQLVRLLVVAVFAIMALQNLGVQLLPLIAGLGVAGAGIALAMQGVLGNIVAGLTIIFTRPFLVGDYIAIVGEEGQVDVVSLFNTTLIHTDRSRVVIPNRKIVGEILHNYGRIRQIDIQVGVTYETDLDRALAAVGEIVNGNPQVLRDPAPVIGVAALSPSLIVLAIRPWTSVPDYVSAHAAINKAIVERFRALGISTAPQNTMVVMQTPG